MHLQRSSVVRATALVVGLAALATSSSSLAAKTAPAWVLDGQRVVAIEAGVGSLAGRYGYDLGPFFANVSLAYDGRGKLSGGGLAGTSIYNVSGTWGVDPATGRAAVHLEEVSPTPKLVFDGVQSEDLLRIDGTYTRVAGFAGISEAAAGPLSLGRTPPVPAETAFTLRFSARQSGGGKISNAVRTVAAKREKVLASLEIFGDEVLESGKVRGKLKTDRAGFSTAKLQVKGKGWSVKMTGPVDADGFHATATVKTPILNLEGVLLELPAEAAPDAPPPPPPSVPEDFLDGAFARIEAGQITITRGNVPKRFFGKSSDLTIRFPATVGAGVTSCTPLTAGGANPRLFLVEQGNKAFGTALEPANVQLDITTFSTQTGQTIRLRATGTTVRDDGKTKTVDVDILATIL